MSKFITSSLWNFGANLVVRMMSIVTFPFLVRFFLREDISIFKSFQAFVLLLLAIIPIGTNILYLAAPQEVREKRWNLFFHVSIIVGVIFSLIILLSDTITSFFIRDQLGGYLRLIMVLLPLIVAFKAIAITKLSSIIDFKGISIALIMKQLLLYTGIISFAFINPTLAVLLIIIFFAEIMELIVLINHSRKMKVSLLPYPDYKRFDFDKTAKKFIACSGTEQIILNFALQFPTILVVIVMGETIAPEFQLPFAAVALPVSLVMNSVAKVSFPHYSNLRENDKIKSSLFSVLFPVTFILFPVLLGIHFFASEITHIFFDKSWQLAIFSLQLFPFLMVAYIIGVPSTFISNIKQKPHINLIYSITLLISRVLTIYFGYRIGGFYGTIILFVVGDMIVRTCRLWIDMSLLHLSLTKFFHYIRYNILSMLILFVLMWLGFYLTGLKLVSFLFACIIAVALNYYWEKDKVREIYLKLRDAIWKRGGTASIPSSDFEEVK